MTEGDWTGAGEHTIQCTDDMLQTCTPETDTILLSNVIPIHSIKKYLGYILKGKKYNNKILCM